MNNQSEISASSVQPTSSESSDRSRWVALYVLCAGVLMIVLDATVVNVALPAIQDELGFSQSGLAWVVNAYLIASGTPRPEALTSGYELAFWVAAGLVVAALVVALIVLEPAPEPVGEEGPDGMTAEEVTAEAGTTL